MKRFRTISKSLRKRDHKKKKYDPIIIQLDEMLKIYREKAWEILKELKSQKYSLGNIKLTFCDDCGRLMIPLKDKERLVVKCECGIIKPIDKAVPNSYTVSKHIEYSFREESIYKCVCGSKFASPGTFLKHAKTCNKGENK